MSLRLSTFLNASDSVNRFWKFGRQNHMPYRTSSCGYLYVIMTRNTNDTVRRVYIAGAHNGGYGYGQGTEQTSTQIIGTWKPISLIDRDNPWEPGETVEEFHLGSNQCYYVTNLRNVYAIGMNGAGQLGIGTTVAENRYYRKITTFNKNVAKLCIPEGQSNYDTCMALTTDGKIFVWAHNTGYGQIPIPNDSNDKLIPVQVNQYGELNGKTIRDAWMSGDTNSGAVTQYGKAWATDSDRILYFSGENTSGACGSRIGTGVKTTTTSWLSCAECSTIGMRCDKIHNVSNSSSSVTFVLDTQLGKLYASGNNGSYQLGVENNTDRAQFQETWASSAYFPGTTVVDFAVGGELGRAVAALLSNGHIVVWGRNAEGQSGRGNATDPIPGPNRYHVHTIFDNTVGGNKVKKMGYIGHNNTTFIVLTENGLIRTCGHNNAGQCARGTPDNGLNLSVKPHPTGRKWVDWEGFGVGNNPGLGNILLAVDEDGQVWGCGYGGRGGLNAGDATNKFSWTLIDLAIQTVNPQV